MAMPIGSMIKYFREEFEAHIEQARAAGEASLIAAGGELAAVPTAGPA
jgi:hypothetical protein